jgi:hypothetical protein
MSNLQRAPSYCYYYFVLCYNFIHHFCYHYLHHNFCYHLFMLFNIFIIFSLIFCLFLPPAFFPEIKNQSFLELTWKFSVSYFAKKYLCFLLKLLAKNYDNSEIFWRMCKNLDFSLSRILHLPSVLCIEDDFLKLHFSNPCPS